MGGIWSPSPPPIRPGLYINFETVGTDAVPAGNNGIVALPITADWGPVGEFAELSSDAQYKGVYGPNNFGKSYLVQEAFRGGALRVLAYRMTDGSETKSALNLTDDAATYAVATVVQGVPATTNAQQEISAAVSATGGSFTLTFTGLAGSPIPAETTAAIAYNATASEVQDALEALPSIAPGDVNVTGGALPGTSVVVEFDGTYGLDDVAVMTVDSSLLQGGDSLVKLEAKYAGTRGDSLRLVVRQNPLDANRKDVLIYEGAELREKYTYEATNHQHLVDQMSNPDKGSALVVASLDPTHPEFSGTYTVQLANNLVGTYMVGGGNGVAGLVVADYTDPLGVLDQYERRGGFDVFALPDEVETSLISAVIDWTKALNEKGTYVMTVVGGDTGESILTAQTRSGAADMEWLVNIGRTDLKVAYPDGSTVIRRTAAMAPRVAGQIAAAGINQAITFADMSAPDSPVEVVTPLTKDEVEEAITSGVLVFTKRGSRVVVEDGVTTYVPDPGNTEKDATFGSIKSVRTMQQIGRDFNEIIENGFIGVTNNNAATRSALISAVNGYLTNLEDQGALVKGSQVLLDERYNNLGDSVHLLLLVQFGRELKRVLMTLRAPILT